MKKLFTLLLLAALLPLTVLAQSSKKKKGTTILASTNFNYYSPLKPYHFLSQSYTQYDDLVLKFFTANSGVFNIQEGDSVLITRSLTSKMPSQLVGLGAGVQFRKLNGLFHELSLTKLSYSKTSNTLIYATIDSMGNPVNSRSLGYDQKNFAVGLRYELGKYFGKQKDAKLRFGLSGGLESNFYRFQSLPKSINDNPLNAKLLTLDLAIIPMLSANLSKKLVLDFKVIPNFLTADFGTMKEENPSFAKRQQGGIRNYKSPDMTWAFSIQLRYVVKEAKKKRSEGG